MRLFIAIDITLNEEIKKLQEKIKKTTKASIPKTLHLTLKFLGEIPESKINLIIENLEKVAFSKFELLTTNIGYFSSINKINVIWLGIKENNELIKLKKEIDESLKENKDNHEFKAHITIARTEHNERLIELINQENKKINKNLINYIKVDSFKLYKSELTKFGASYTLIKEFKEKQNDEIKIIKIII